MSDKKTKDTATKAPEAGNGESVTNPNDAILKLTEVELLKFNNLTLKIERTLQAIRLLQFENDQAHRRFITETHERNKQIEQGQNTVGRFEKERERMAYELADKYGVPAKYLAIDDETGVVKELPHGPEDAEAQTEGQAN